MENTQTNSPTLLFSDVTGSRVTTARVLLWYVVLTSVNWVRATFICTTPNSGHIELLWSSAYWLLFYMATPHYQSLKDNQQLLATIDVCMKSDSDKSEQRVDLIRGGKYSCRLRRVSALIYCDIYCDAAGLLVADPGNCLREECTWLMSKIEIR